MAVVDPPGPVARKKYEWDRPSHGNRTVVLPEAGYGPTRAPASIPMPTEVAPANDHAMLTVAKPRSVQVTAWGTESDVRPGRAGAPATAPSTSTGTVVAAPGVDPGVVGPGVDPGVVRGVEAGTDTGVAGPLPTVLDPADRWSAGEPDDPPPPQDASNPATDSAAAAAPARRTLRTRTDAARAPAPAAG